MDTPNWGLNSWGSGTSYTPEGAFFQRDLQGNPNGLTQGAFNGIGAGMQGAGMAMMSRGRPAGEMAMMGLANGANTWQKQQQQHQAQTQDMGGLKPGGPMSGIGLLSDLFGGGDAKSAMGLRSVPDMWKRFKGGQAGAFQFPSFGGGQ